MILSEARLREVPSAFRAMTGMSVDEFTALARDIVPSVASAEATRRSRRKRQRAVGGGHPFTLSFRAQLLLVVVWLRVYPTSPVLGFLFGISHPTVLRTIARVLPILEQPGGTRCGCRVTASVVGAVGGTCPTCWRLSRSWR